MHRRCPLCQVQLPDELHLRIAFLVSQLVEEQLVFCRFRAAGCPWQGPLATLPTHTSSCPKAPPLAPVVSLNAPPQPFPLPVRSPPSSSTAAPSLPSSQPPAFALSHASPPAAVPLPRPASHPPPSLAPQVVPPPRAGAASLHSEVPAHSSLPAGAETYERALAPHARAGPPYIALLGAASEDNAVRTACYVFEKRQERAFPF